MCALDEETAINSLPELIAMLPSPIYGKQEWNNDEVDYFNIENKEEIEKAIKEVMEKSHCPACTLAALRQKKINVRATSFDYKKEAKSFFDDRKPDIDYGCCY